MHYYNPVFSVRCPNKCIFKIYSFLTAWDKMVLSFDWTAQAHKHGNNKCFKVSGALSGRKLICIITASFITTFFFNESDSSIPFWWQKWIIPWRDMLAQGAIWIFPVL